ncbi:MAG: dihydrodipicolinate synthase family protein, partial [Dyadobacter sp.]
MNKASWQGVFPALLTPFNADDTIDFDMFEKNLLAQVEAGITGVIVAGSLGEASTLTTEEKFELVKFAKKA